MSSKKGKKSKSQKVSLQEFLAKDGSGSGGTTQVTIQKVSNWADECDDDDERQTRSEVIELPTAPRSARIFDDDLVGHDGPFIAKVSNLPFDTNEGEIEDFFADHDILIREMRLVRENDRLRGFGTIEFQERADLMSALMLPDTTIRNRRVRIELANENDNRDRGMRKRFDYGPRDGGNDTNWRDRKDTGGNGSFDEPRRDNNRDRGDRDNRRGGDYNRSNFQNRHDSNNNDGGDMNNWRMGERERDASPPPERRRFDRNDRNERNDRRGDDRRGGDRRDNYERRAPAPEEERPVIKLAPRTKPMPVLEFPTEKELERHSNRRGSAEEHHDGAESQDDKDEKSIEVKIIPKPKPIPNAAVFGDAKPVDTAAREREIEEKIAQERKTREEALIREREQSESASAEQPEVRKDIIVIKTEKTRLAEEANNWRHHDEPSSDPPRNREDQGRRFNNDRRTDDDHRNMRYKDSRNFNNNQRGNDNFRQGNGNRGPPRGNANEPMRREGPRRDAGGEIKRHVIKDPEERMPKYQPSSGPNLDISNAFAGLDDEVDVE